MIEIINAELTREKTQRAKEENERRTKERKYKNLKKIVMKIQDEIDEAADNGLCHRRVKFAEIKEMRGDDIQDKWYYLPDLVDDILTMYSTAGYEISWTPVESCQRYGWFDILWAKA